LPTFRCNAVINEPALNCLLAPASCPLFHIVCRAPQLVFGFAAADFQFPAERAI